MTTKRFNIELKKLQAHRDRAMKKASETPEEQQFLRGKRASISGAQQLIIVELLLDLLKQEHPELADEVNESIPILRIAESTLPEHIDALKEITVYMEMVREIKQEIAEWQKALRS